MAPVTGLQSQRGSVGPWQDRQLLPLCAADPVISRSEAEATVQPGCSLRLHDRLVVASVKRH